MVPCHNIICNIVEIHNIIYSECEKHLKILCGILLVPQNILIDMNNVMTRPLVIDKVS